jgi:ribosome biogenesis GTPase
VFTLEQLGFGRFFSSQFALSPDNDNLVARVVADGLDVFPLAGIDATFGELSGKLRQHIGNVPMDRPIVGDWVTVTQQGDRAVIHHLLDRRTLLLRRAAGSLVQAQAIAANVDQYFIVTAPGSDFSPRRLERYVAAVWDSGASPIVVLNKTDLEDHLEPLLKQIAEVALALPIVAVSATTGVGLETLQGHLKPGTTSAFIGSSGVGKSSLLNQLMGTACKPTSTLDSTGRGRHTTTRRELVVLPSGGALIDTPGLREFGLVEEGSGLDVAFADILALASSCRYGDCSHTSEPGCAVLKAVGDGRLPSSRHASYIQLRREASAAAARRSPAQMANSKKRWKSIHKQVRSIGKLNPKYRDE